jgi:hypothetical protein
MCNVASCWIYIGILLGAHPILHISRIRVNTVDSSDDEHKCARNIERIGINVKKESCLKLIIYEN